MEIRTIFDTIPERFDRYRPRYCPELFESLIRYAGIGPGSSALEIGPGTGQATEPILQTGCDYHAIELGEHLCGMMRRNFGQYPNFSIVHDDFITHDFGGRTFDLVYSAATIQWIPEEIAFTKTYRMLKPGGYLAMFMARSDEVSANPDLRAAIDRVYDEHFRVKQAYSCRLTYENALNYGFQNLRYKEWKTVRRLTADEYLCYISTHCAHITLEEPYRSRFFAGIREAVLAAGNMIEIRDTIPLYLVQKPL